MKLLWHRSEEGYVHSHCGKFLISPLYCGCTTPQFYSVTMTNPYRGGPTMCSSIKEAKVEAQAWADRLEAGK